MRNMEAQMYGVKLQNPLVVGASSFTARLKKIKEMESAGVAAIVVKSLFEEEIQLERMHMEESLNQYNNLHAEMISQYPAMDHAGNREHLLMVKHIKESVSIPVIASVNAVTPDGWVQYAVDLANMGVDALELNFYTLPVKETVSPHKIEEDQCEILRSVKSNVSIPVGVKISPYYTHLFHFSQSLENAGADGITMFNRFFQPDIDIVNEKEMTTFSFSQTGDNLLHLRWIGLLKDRVSIPLTASNGVLDGEDMIKALLSGADSAQVVSTLYKNGVGHLTAMLNELEKWMTDNEYESIDDFKGKLSKSRQRDPWSYERVQYIEMLLRKGNTP